jgi:putative Holliday junction resolvase
MPRILAIDYGSKRTGIAVTDPSQIIATALETVPTHTLFSFLKSYMERESVEAIVIGMPKGLDNLDTHNTGPVRGAIRRLNKEFPDLPVYEHDERFTSSMAMQAMISGGTSKKDRREKSNLDKISATIILQSFMESRQR